MTTVKTDAVISINPEQAVRSLGLCWKAERIARKHGLNVTVPVILVGGTGSAKTSSVRKFVNWLNEKLVNGDEDGKYELWLNSLSQFADTGDYGMPVPDMENKIMDFFGHGKIPFDQPDAKGVLLFDEWDRNEQTSVSTVAGSIALDRAWHNKKIGDDVYICGTINGTGDVQTSELSEFVRTRCVTLFMARNADGFVESYDKYAEEHNISAVARTFSKFRRDLLAPDPVYEELAVCQPRTVDMADMILQASTQVKFQTDDILLACIAGCIGKKAALEFLAMQKLITEAPSIEEILANPDKAKLPESPSVIYALCCGLSGLQSDKLSAHADKLATYGARLTPEFSAMLFKRISLVAPRIVTTKEFQSWAKENKALLI